MLPKAIFGIDLQSVPLLNRRGGFHNLLKLPNSETLARSFLFKSVSPPPLQARDSSEDRSIVAKTGAELHELGQWHDSHFADC